MSFGFIKSCGGDEYIGSLGGCILSARRINSSVIGIVDLCFWLTMDCFGA